MGRLAGFTPRDIERVATQLGWRYQRSRGSHAMYTQPGGQRPLVIPQHRELREGTVHGMVKQMGLSVEEFLRLVRG